MSTPIVRYVPFQSKADPSFWMKLGDHKLNTLRLTEEPLKIEGKYSIQSTILHRQNENSKSNSTAVPGRMRFDQDSIDDAAPTETDVDNVIGNENVLTKGQIQILNTIESFKSTDKNQLLNKYCLGKLIRTCVIYICRNI